MTIHEVISFEAYFHGDFDNRCEAEGLINSTAAFERFIARTTKELGDWSCSFGTKVVTRQGEESFIIRIIKLDGKLNIGHAEKK